MALEDDIQEMNSNIEKLISEMEDSNRKLADIDSNLDDIKRGIPVREESPVMSVGIEGMWESSVARTNEILGDILRQLGG